MNRIESSYLVRKGSEEYATIASKFDGVRILKIDDISSLGKPVNIYTAQWINSQQEDYMLTSQSVIRENVDLSITFIVGDKYAQGVINVAEQHDNFVEYMTSGDIYIKSLYEDKEAHCVCLESYSPTNSKLKRPLNKNWKMGTIKLHTLTKPVDVSEEQIGDVYIGFGASVLASLADITNLVNVQHYNKDTSAGEYSIISDTSISYLWICTSNPLGSVTSSGFEVPINTPISVGNLRCYRSANSIAPNVSMNFTITA